jgi:hypothetical protein
MFQPSELSDAQTAAMALAAALPVTTAKTGIHLSFHPTTDVEAAAIGNELRKAGFVAQAGEAGTARWHRFGLVGRGGAFDITVFDR